jgi:TRAP-type uncharacterized transport system fused permease subunit
MIGSWYLIAMSFITAAIGLIFIAAALEAYLHKHLLVWERLLFILIGFGLVIPDIYAALCSLLMLVAYGLLFFSNKIK